MVHKQKHQNEIAAIKTSKDDLQWPQYVAAIAACMYGLMAGNVLGWSSPAQLLVIPPVGNSTNFTSQYNFKMTENEFSWAVSSIGLGAGVCSLFIGAIQDMIGRKYTILLITLPFIIGWAMVTGAQNFATLLIGRIFGGAAAGSVGVAASTYIGEISDKHIRGQLGTYIQLSGTIGILMVYAIGASMSLLALNVVCLILPFIFGLIFLFMPESPHYLVRKHRFTDAISSLKWLHGKNYDPKYEMTDIVHEDQIRNLDTTSKWKALRSKAVIKALYISMGLMFFVQWCGLNAVTFYTGYIFQEARTTLPPILTSIIVAALQVVATFFSSFVVDKLGRRILLILSITIMLICTILLGVFFYLLEIKSPHAANLHWLPVFALCLFIVALSFGCGPIPFIIIGEIFSQKTKPIGASLAISLNWFMAFVIGKIFPILTAAIGIGETFWLFSGFAFVTLFFILFFVPETKKKSLREVQEMLETDGFFVKLF